MTGESNALTRAVTVRLTKRDAELLQEEANRRGFATTGSFARKVLLGSLAQEDERSNELELLLQIRFMIAENFRAVTPEEEQEALEKIQERAEVGSQALLKEFLQRRSGMVASVVRR